MVTTREVEIRLDKISFLIYKASLLQAYHEYELLLEEIQQTMSSSSVAGENEEKEKEGIQKLMETNQEMLDGLRERYREIDQTIHECTSPHEEWTLGSDRFGVPTYYRVDDDGLLCLRIEGSQETPIFEQMAVLYEVALHNEWVPFCDRSNLLKKMSHSEFIWYSRISTPVAIRDLVVHLYAADCTKEKGCIAFVGKSVHEYPSVEMPPEPNPFFGYRVDIKFMRGIISIESPTMAKTVILAKVDVKVALPQSLINFVLRQLAGVFLYHLQQQAVKVSQSPNSSHARAIHENIQFYTEFLLPIIRSYCQMKGWEQVPVLVLGEAGIPIPGEDFSDYPRYEPFTHRNQERADKKKSSKARPMVLNIV